MQHPHHLTALIQQSSFSVLLVIQPIKGLRKCRRTLQIYHHDIRGCHCGDYVDIVFYVTPCGLAVGNLSEEQAASTFMADRSSRSPRTSVNIYQTGRRLTAQGHLPFITVHTRIRPRATHWNRRLTTCLGCAVRHNGLREERRIEDVPEDTRRRQNLDPKRMA